MFSSSRNVSEISDISCYAALGDPRNKIDTVYTTRMNVDLTEQRNELTPSSGEISYSMRFGPRNLTYPPALSCITCVNVELTLNIRLDTSKKARLTLEMKNWRQEEEKLSQRREICVCHSALHLPITDKTIV